MRSIISPSPLTKRVRPVSGSYTSRTIDCFASCSSLDIGIIILAFAAFCSCSFNTALPTAVVLSTSLGPCSPASCGSIRFCRLLLRLLLLLRLRLSDLERPLLDLCRRERRDLDLLLLFFLFRWRRSYSESDPSLELEEYRLRLLFFSFSILWDLLWLLCRRFLLEAEWRSTLLHELDSCSTPRRAGL